MLRKLLVLGFICLNLTNFAQAQELNLRQGKIYILNFDEEIQNIHTSQKWLDAQILHTIDNDKKQIVLSLKEDKEGFLQIKTENNFYNYEIKPAKNSSKELLEVDYPPIENLDVDIYTGD